MKDAGKSGFEGGFAVEEAQSEATPPHAGVRTDGGRERGRVRGRVRVTGEGYWVK